MERCGWKWMNWWAQHLFLFLIRRTEPPVRWTLWNHVMWLERHNNQPTPLPDVTDLSGTSRGALPPPARGTAFELLLAVMLVCKQPTHLMDKHKDVKHSKRCSLPCNLDLRFTKGSNPLMNMDFNPKPHQKPDGKHACKTSARRTQHWVSHQCEQVHLFYLTWLCSSAHHLGLMSLWHCLTLASKGERRFQQ